MNHAVNTENNWFGARLSTFWAASETLVVITLQHRAYAWQITKDVQDQYAQLKSTHGVSVKFARILNLHT